MKKFLVIMLVLALTSMASAVSISLTSGGLSSVVVPVAGTVITVDLTVDDAPAGGINSIDFLASGGASINAVGAWSVFTFAPFAGTLTAGDIMRASGNAAAGTDIAAGTVLYSFQVTVNDTGALTPQMTAADWGTDNGPLYAWQPTAQNALSVSVVPEPMTIALLGLGGLFLRRRK